MKIHLFFDHSVLDIFINDRWATSVRVFPTSSSATGVSLFADGTTVLDGECYALVWTADGATFGGIAAEVTPWRYLVIYAGVGVGRDGLRVAGGVRRIDWYASSPSRDGAQARPVSVTADITGNNFFIREEADVD